MSKGRMEPELKRILGVVATNAKARSRNAISRVLDSPLSAKDVIEEEFKAAALEGGDLLAAWWKDHIRR